MNLSDKIIGIWGYGLVGQSVAHFLKDKTTSIVVFDDNSTRLTSCSFKIASTRQELFETTHVIVPSPGVDTRTHRSHYTGMWLSELDLFYDYKRIPLIAVTGSLGKTTITHTLAELLSQSGMRVVAAGNIGNPLCSIIEQQDTLDMAVIELSSFQLEYVSRFAPDIAMVTNVYPNHLDRHGTMQEYFAAKYSIMKYQSPRQKAIIPCNITQWMSSFNPHSSLITVDTQHYKTTKPGLSANWALIDTTMEQLALTVPQNATISPLPHRMEKVANINGVTFYNDSKSTTPVSTISALTTISEQHVLLLLGGLSKGVDRKELVASIAQQHKRVFIICFGREASQLASACTLYTIAHASFSSLNQALLFCSQQFHHYEAVLFSPSGTSYDEFNNFAERGERFKHFTLQLSTAP